MNTIANDLAEARMVESARLKFRRALVDAQQASREVDAAPYRAVVSLAVDAARVRLAEMLTPVKGRPSVGVLALRESGLEPEVIAAIAMQTLITGSAKGEKALQSATLAVGAHIEDEIRVRWLASEAPGLVKYLDKENARKGSTDYGHRRAVFMSAIPRMDVAETRERWDLRTKAQVGLVLTDLFVDLGVFALIRKGRGRDQRLHISLTPEALSELATLTERMEEFVRPEYRPMLAPPRDWVSPTEGGYHRLDVPIMKNAGKADMKRLATSDMGTVYAAMNAIQRTAWAVNEDVLVVVEEMMANRTPVKGLPEVDDLGEPQRPLGIPARDSGVALTDEQRAALKEYKVAKRAWFDAMAARASRTSHCLQTVVTARDLRGERFYFPQQLDFRGRIYSVPTGLTPQGNDLSKGLLTFAEGRRLGTWGAFWLAVHGANSFGKDKGPLSERVDWVLEHQDLILEVAADPLGNLWWTEADGGQSPFQFLAFCFEWAGYVEAGESEDFVSHLPVGVDGSCNGLQHYSAMLRDPVGASAVNLRSGRDQQDIYSAVAQATEALVRAKMEESEQDRELGGRWLAHGVTRKVVKRSVMTTPYGVTAQGINSHIKEDTTKGAEEFAGVEFEAAAWLGELVRQAIGSTVAAAEEAMSFLRGLAKVTNKADMGISWVTPAGLPVLQRVNDYASVRIDTRLLGRVVLSYAEDTLELAKRRQTSGIAPNFVHSLDAAHLMLTVQAFEREHGPTSWAMVHDSYGTHAGLIQDLGNVLREEFVAMYADACPLEDIRESVLVSTGNPDVDPVPSKGSFDLNEVLEAEFFFA